MSVTPQMTAEVISALYDALVDMAKRSGLFDGGTADHESRSTPERLSCEVLMGPLKAVGRASGLSASSARQEFTIRVRGPRMAEPDGETDRSILYAAVYMMTAIHQDLDLDEVGEVAAGMVRNVDVLGTAGDPIGMQPGWLQQSGAPYRVAEVTVGIILNDVFPQVM
jgi:hypothetical protein